ncbi:MAG TPA: hypothetical protein VER03_22945, partial [Bryobacteraceae bacterium]|nr:hypothetical protein [Bryobacteraceae bacterium]
HPPGTTELRRQLRGSGRCVGGPAADDLLAVDVDRSTGNERPAAPRSIVSPYGAGLGHPVGPIQVYGPGGQGGGISDPGGAAGVLA